MRGIIGEEKTFFGWLEVSRLIGAFLSRTSAQNAPIA